jgi:hypothetical protein
MNNRRMHVLFEAFNRRAETRQASVLIIASSLLLLAVCCITLGVIQYQNYERIVNNSTNVEMQRICKIFDYGNFEIVLSSLALLIMLIYVSLFKRRSFLRNKLKTRQFGLPSIVSCW